MKNKKLFFTAKWISYTAIMTALVIATCFIPYIPTPAGKIYWVDGMVLIAAFLLDPFAAFIAGGIGSLIYDVIASPEMMLPSLLIHGLQGAVVSSIVHFVFPKLKKFEWVKALTASVIGGVIVVTGYFIYRCLTRGTPVAIASIPRNIIQTCIGITVAMIICYATTFKRQLEKNRLLPDFKAEVLNKPADAVSNEIPAETNSAA